MKNRPKVQHYVAQSFLRGFAVGAGRQALIYVYERGKTNPFRQKPQQAARETDYYCFRDSYGLRDNSIEDLLGIVESDPVPVSRKISSGDAQLTWDERNKLALFIGFQEFRVPWMRQQLGDLYGKLIDFAMRTHVKVPGLLEHDMQRLIDEGHNFEGVSPQSLREFIEQKEYTIKVSPQASLSTLLHMAPVVSAYYREMEWTVVKCRDKSGFITSDNPVVKFAPESTRLSFGLGIMNPAIQVWFALSKSASLIIRHDKDRMQAYEELLQRGDEAKAAELRDAVPRITYRTATAPIIQNMNYMTASYAMRYVFSPVNNDALPDQLKGGASAIRFRMA